MRFIKMTGLGNDYVYVDAISQQVHNPAALAVKVANRNFGIGSDGLILILPPEEGVDAHVRMRMFNADGSEGAMCGNGIRCLCKMVHDHKLGPAPDANPLKVQTPVGVLTLDYKLDLQGKVQTVKVDMGPPTVEPEAVPIDTDLLVATDQAQTFKLNAPGTTERFNATFVGIGNPNAVIFRDHVDTDNPDELLAWGKALEHHEAFPKRMNIHFVQVLSEDTVRVVHWERGSGPTMACGTGACAVCVAGVLTGKTGRAITAKLPGGDLQLHWADSMKTHGGHVFMTGPATEVYTGEWPE